MNPACNPQEIATICSPIQASGSTLTCRSWASNGSIAIRLRPMNSMLVWLSMASFGIPVVPEVVHTTATSLPTPASNCRSSQSGRSRSKLAALSLHRVELASRYGWSYFSRPRGS